MKKTALAVAASAAAAISLGAATAPLAQASGLHVTVSPTKPKPGQTVTAKLTGGAHKAKYYCIMGVEKAGTTPGVNSADVSSLQTLTTNSHGAATCHQVFFKFTVKEKYKGKAVSCPPSKAEKKAGFKCGVAFANVKNHKQFSFGVFKF
jgi:hypothetical protein